MKSKPIYPIFTALAILAYGVAAPAQTFTTIMSGENREAFTFLYTQPQPLHPLPAPLRHPSNPRSAIPVHIWAPMPRSHSPPVTPPQLLRGGFLTPR